MTSFVFCWLLENDFRKGIFEKFTTSNDSENSDSFRGRKNLTSELTFLSALRNHKPSEKNFGSEENSKRENMNPERERMMQMAELQAMKDVLNSLLDVCHPR